MWPLAVWVNWPRWHIGMIQVATLVPRNSMRNRHEVGMRDIRICIDSAWLTQYLRTGQEVPNRGTGMVGIHHTVRKCKSGLRPISGRFVRGTSPCQEVR